MNRKDSKKRVLQKGESERKDGTYQYRWTDVFGKRHTVYAPELNALRLKEKEILKAELNGTLYIESNLTVSEFVNIYLDRKKNIRESTGIVYDSTAKRINGTPLAKMKLSDVRYIHCEHFLEDLQIRDGLSYATVLKTKNFFKTIFEEAVKNDFIRKNPFDCSTASLVKDTKKREALTPEEFETYLIFARKYGRTSMLPDILELIFHTGLRISEVISLTGKDIDLQNAILTVNQQITRSRKGIAVSDLKTDNAHRSIPLDSTAFAICKKYMKKEYKIMPCIDGVTGFLFVTRNGNVESKNTVENFMLRVKRKWDEENPGNAMKNFTPHILRHSFCTDLINKGVNIKTVQSIMGHANVSITLDIYSHKQNQEAVEELREFFGGLV